MIRVLGLGIIGRFLGALGLGFWVVREDPMEIESYV